MKIKPISLSLLALVFGVVANAAHIRWSYAFQSGDYAYGEFEAVRKKGHYEVEGGGGGRYHLRLTDGRVFSAYVDVFYEFEMPVPYSPWNSTFIGGEDYGRWDSDFSKYTDGFSTTFMSYDWIDILEASVVYYDVRAEAPYVLLTREENGLAGWRIYGVPDGGSSACMIAGGFAALALGRRSGLGRKLQSRVSP